MDAKDQIPSPLEYVAEHPLTLECSWCDQIQGY